MIVTRLRPAVLRLPATLGRHGCVNCTKRFIASGPPHSPAPTAAVPAAILSSLTNELDKIAPRFEVDAERIQIIRSPADFYAELKVDDVCGFHVNEWALIKTIETDTQGKDTDIPVHVIYRKDRTRAG